MTNLPASPLPFLFPCRECVATEVDINGWCYTCHLVQRIADLESALATAERERDEAREQVLLWSGKGPRRKTWWDSETMHSHADPVEHYGIGEREGFMQELHELLADRDQWRARAERSVGLALSLAWQPTNAANWHFHYRVVVRRLEEAIASLDAEHERAERYRDALAFYGNAAVARAALAEPDTVTEEAKDG